MRWLALIFLLILLISVVRVSLGLAPATFADLLSIIKNNGFGLDPLDVFSRIGETFNDMIEASQIGGRLNLIWTDVDFLSFFPKLGETIATLFSVVYSWVSGLFITVGNVLAFPVEGLLFVLRIIFWIIGIPVAS